MRGVLNMSLAYLLIHSAPNKTLELCKSLKLVNGVVETYTLLNGCDLLAKLEWGQDELTGDNIIERISHLDGIIRMRALRTKDFAK
jgi:hypothetical protein